MIRLSGVTYTYPDSPRPVLAGINLEVAAGEFLVVAGPSGSGKSTLLRCLNGLVPHFYGGTFAGQVDVLGHDPVAEGPGAMSAWVGLVFQTPEAQCVATTVEEELAFAMENRGLPESTMRQRIAATMAALGIDHLAGRRLETLSGGERQRVAIGAVLTLQPRLLVLDEPTSQLDPAGAEEVLAAVARLNRDLGLTVILCEHRLERVVSLARRMAYLSGPGRPLLVGEPRAVLQRMADVPPVVALGKALGWSPLPLDVEEARNFVAVAGGVEQGRRTSGKWQAASSLAAGTLATCDLLPKAPPADPFSSPSFAIRVSGLSFSYNGSPALRGVDLEVSYGEIVALMGSNGAGKTTLLKLLVGLLRAEVGAVAIAGLDPRRVPLSRLIEHVGYVPQNPDALLFADTVRDELDYTLRQRGRPAGDYGALPGEIGLDTLLERYPRDLSVGERQRVALAAVLVAGPEIILLDEPTRGLDSHQKEALVRFLQAARARGRAVLLATHDVELAARCADRIVLLEQGSVRAAGPTGEVMARFPAFASQVSRLYGEARYRTVEDVLGAPVVVQQMAGEVRQARPGAEGSKLQVRNSKSEFRISLTPWIVALASLIGVVAFLYPFFAGPVEAGGGFLAHAADAPVVTLLCVVAILAGLEVRGLGAKQVALLGILAAIGALLRPIPGPFGFSLLFFLPILCGYAVGPTFGFLLGALTLLLSALVTSGIGPWLPYQMLTTGWVGLLAGFLPNLRRWRRGEVAVLAAFSLLLGLFFGAVMNLWFWPFLGLGADSAILWQPGLPLGETLLRYARFYLATSLAWDLGRGLGNVLLIVVLGPPVLRLLRRFSQRFAFRRA